MTELGAAVAAAASVAVLSDLSLRLIVYSLMLTVITARTLYFIRTEKCRVEGVPGKVSLNISFLRAADNPNSLHTSRDSPKVSAVQG